MTQHAACRDNRFYTFTHQEVKSTLISISIVTNLQQITNYPSMQSARGIWFKYDNSSAISLPTDFPVHDWNYQEVLTDLCFQAGVTLSAWREAKAKIYTFQSIKFQES